MDIKKLFRQKAAPINYGKGVGSIFQNQAPNRTGLDQFLRAYGEDPWLHAVVSRISAAVAETKWHLYDSQNENERKEITEHEFLKVWNKPNPFYTLSDQLELSQIYLDLTGKSYWVKTQDAGKKECWIVPSPYMKPIPDPIKFIKGYIYERNNEKVPFEVNEVIPFVHVDPLNVLDGVGPAQAMGIELDISSFMRQFNRNYFYNNAEPGTVLSYPGDVPQGELDRLTEKINQGFRGYGRAHKLMIVSGGASVTKNEVGRKDMDFAALAKWIRDCEIGTFGMPGVLLGVQENANRAIAQTAEFTFARWVVKPRLEFIRRKVNEFWLPDFGDNLYIDFDDPTPEDAESEAKISQLLVDAGILTIDEARALNDYDELPKKTGRVFKIPIATTLIPEDSGINQEVQEPETDTATPNQPKSLKGIKLPASHEIYLRHAASFEPKVADVMRGIFNEQKAEALSHQSIDRHKSKKMYVDRMKPILSEVMAVSARNAQGMVKATIPYVLDKDAVKWLLTRIGWAAEAITEQTALALSNLLAEGVTNATPTSEIANQIEALFNSWGEAVDTSRAMMIARTEIIQAAAEGTLTGYKSMGVEYVQFSAAPDACEDCMGAEEEFDKVAIDDAEGIITVHPNCKCGWVAVIE